LTKSIHKLDENIVNFKEILRTLKLYLIILPKKSTKDENFACDEYIRTKIILVTNYEK
jgi:hypothetical protein